MNRLLSIAKVIPESQLVFLCPHYDDVPLTFGGYLGELRKAGLRKTIRIVHIFSRSNYQARDEAGNADSSLKRAQYATGVRLLEDLNCLDALIGHGAYAYELLHERESVLRGKGWKPGEKFEFPHGNQSTFDKEDWEIFRRLRSRFSEWLTLKDTAVLALLGVKEHVDHVMVRDAMIEARRKLGQAGNASVYFGEEQPYSGLADESDNRLTAKTVRRLGLEPRDYAIDAERKMSLIWKHYPTQVEKSYRLGVVGRAEQLKQLHGARRGVERIYRWPSR